MRISRRSFAAAAVSLTGAAACSSRNELARRPPVPASETTGTSVAPAAPEPPAQAPTDDALNRLTFGSTAALVGEVEAMGFDAWLDAQLDPAAHTDPAELTAALAPLATLTTAPDELASRLGTDQPAVTQVARELVLATILRQIHHPAQLHEIMVELWTNHFAINLAEGPLRVLKAIDDRNVIRPHAMGRFADLLVASAQSPAMLVSLDNSASKAGAINENYSRELLELHTVGVDGGYGEDDVVAVANTLTGWTQRRGVFEFRSDWHDPTPQRVMEWSTPSGATGMDAGLSLLDHLAHHRSTARYVARKLLVRFVSDRPDESYVSDVAEAYLANDTAIAPTLRALVTDERFASTTTPKFRRPHELFVATMRAAGGTLDATAFADQRTSRRFDQYLRALGQPPMQWPAPNGYPDTAEAWLQPGAMVTRWNAIADLFGDGVPGLSIEALSGGLDPTEAALTAAAPDWQER
jgi:uncharacterized protein (DUF1800 family)